MNKTEIQIPSNELINFFVHCSKISDDVECFNELKKVLSDSTIESMINDIKQKNQDINLVDVVRQIASQPC